MGLFSATKIFGFTIRESADDGSDFTNPDADYRRVFLGEDGELHARDSSGTVTTLGGSGAVTSHTGDTSDAHDASAISVLDTATNFTGTDVEAVLAELQDNIDGVGGSSIPNLFVGTVPPWATASVATAFTANRANIVKVILTDDAPNIDTVRWACTTSNGNLDFGIYDSGLNRLASTGSFASPGTGNRSQALTGSVNLTAGTVYYFAFATSSTTFRMPVVNVNAISTGYNLWGRMESALALPTTITVAAWEDATVGFPVFYFTT